MVHSVFVIDDSEIDQLYARILFERLDPPVAVQAFDSAADALQALRQAAPQPDLILLDINMPGMSGFEFLDAYGRESHGGGSAVPVVMLTSSPEAADRQKAFAHAAVRGYVVKPIDGDTAASLVRQLG